MERELLSYYVIVNLQTLDFLDSNGNFTDIENAAKFYELKQAEDFLLQQKELINDSAIYKVNTQIATNLMEYGKQINHIILK